MRHESFPSPARMAQLRLGMAQCGWRGLSEGWLLRHLGDVHWGQIAQAMGQSVAVFHDEDGAPVYAAFCAIAVNVAQPALARPGAVLSIGSRLRRLSTTRLISFHDLSIDGLPFGDVTMITIFVRHDASRRNAQIQRVQPRGVLRVPMMDPGADAGLVDEAAQLIRRLKADGPHPEPVGEIDVTPCPTTDFNAAGLLYCASYPALADRAEWAVMRQASQGFLIRRRIVFLGNVDPAEPLFARLWCDPMRAGGHHITLAAQDRLIAHVSTQKMA